MSDIDELKDTASQAIRKGLDFVKLGKGIVGMFGTLLEIAIVLACIVRVTAVTNIEPWEAGYRFDRWNGELKVLEKKNGWAFYWPIRQTVHTVDLRPWQVRISANKRILNAKLVEFNPAGLALFVKWHGRQDYEHGSEHEGTFDDILKSYAFDGSGKSYPFLTILRDLKPVDLTEASK